jgi:integrase
MLFALIHAKPCNKKGWPGMLLEPLLNRVEIEPAQTGFQSLLAKLVTDIALPLTGRAIRYACRLAFPASKGLKGDALKAWHSEHSWAPNQLRHAMATEVRKSDGLEAASVLLGHSGLVITQTYAEQDKAKAIEVIARVG